MKIPSRARTSSSLQRRVKFVIYAFNVFNGVVNWSHLKVLKTSITWSTPKVLGKTDDLKCNSLHSEHSKFVLWCLATRCMANTIQLSTMQGPSCPANLQPTFCRFSCLVDGISARPWRNVLSDVPCLQNSGFVPPSMHLKSLDGIRDLKYSKVFIAAYDLKSFQCWGGLLDLRPSVISWCTCGLKAVMRFWCVLGSEYANRISMSEHSDCMGSPSIRQVRDYPPDFSLHT
jgi:hypothetical protein